ncbi:MAG: ribonuclease P protein component [Chloroflexota bacterium]
MSRLKANSDFRRVRREGRSWSHPLIVLIARANDLNETRIGVAASKTVGSAVVRNRAKRRLREAVRRAESTMAIGWDVLLVARPGLPKAKWSDVTQALAELLNRARLLRAG